MTKKNRKELLGLLADKLAWLLISFFGHAGRISIRNINYWWQVVRSDKPFIIACWHGRMVLPIFIHRRQNIVAMVSAHEDGEMIARTIMRLGYATIRGSSTRGGSQAFRQMLRLLKQGQNCTVLPDGPRGPRCEFKLGTILLAQRGDAYILPVTFSAKYPITLKSWDKFTLWWPFSPVIAMYGEPMLIPKKISSNEIEAQRRAAEERMNELQRRADAIFRT